MVNFFLIFQFVKSNLKKFKFLSFKILLIFQNELFQIFDLFQVSQLWRVGILAEFPN